MYSVSPSKLTVLFKGADVKPGQGYPNPEDMEVTAVAELSNKPRRDPGPELRNMPDLEPMQPALPVGEVQGLAVGVGGETAVAELNNGST